MSLQQKQELLRVRNTEVKCPCGCNKVFRITGQMKGCKPFESLYKQLQTCAARRGHTVNMSFEEFLSFVHTSQCHYCEEEIIFLPHNSKGKRSAVNLDRKDNSLGYTKENCVVCCMACNRGKNKVFTYEEWVVMTAALKEYRHGTVQETPGNFGSGPSGPGVPSPSPQRANAAGSQG
jgi:hypothetical protein